MGDAVKARGPVPTGSRCALVDFGSARAHGHIYEAIRTGARVLAQTLVAHTTVDARPREALVRVRFAVDANIANGARAFVGVREHGFGEEGVRACGAIHARRRAALVYVCFAVISLVTGRAQAHVKEKTIHARGSVLARVRSALVEVELAVLAGPSVFARARVLEDACEIRAGAVVALRAVLARGRLALRHVRAVLATVVGLVTRVADALVLPRTGVEALAANLVTRKSLGVSTRVDLELTVVTVESRHTRALVPVHLVGARGRVLARGGSALVDVDLAVVARVTDRAHAAVRERVVEARRTVQTRR